MNVPCGREDIARLFQNSIANNRLSQAYIISADKGMGKKTIAHYAASLILCDSSQSCGSCPSCKSMEKGTHPDLVILKRDEDKATLGVDNVRDIKAEVYTRPVMSRYKVVLVYEMHLATVSAQNAMLKMIEEPPENVIFILLADNTSPILPTILSRTMNVPLKPLTAEDMKKVTGASDFEISISGGNVGRLLSMRSDTGYSDLRDEVTDAFFSVFSDDPYAPYQAAEALDKLKTDKDEIFDIILMLSRDMYMAKTGLGDLVINKDKFNYINTAVSALSAETIWKVANNVITAEKEKGKNGSFIMAVTILFLKCRAEMKKQKGKIK